jgi:signal transduction histidine kinase
VNRLSQRVARLTPSITAGLIFLAVGLTGLLAYRAFDASRAQKHAVENTLRDYAGFAAFQLKIATINRVMGQSRGAFELVVRTITTSGPKPSLGVDRAAALIQERGPLCRCLDGVSFYYQVTFADSAITSTVSDIATPENLRRIRDTVLAHAQAPGRPDPPLNNPTTRRLINVPATSQSLVTIFSSLSDRPYVFTYALTADALGRPVVAYGFAVPAEQAVGRTVKAVLAAQPILPTTLTRGLRMDSILDVTVTSPSGKFIYASNERIDARYASIDSLEPRLGGLRFEVALKPESAGRLIIGGLPRSRLPEVLATSVVAVGLLILLLFQFRRQEELGRLRDEFVSGVSHELRTPLAQIRLLAELLRLDKVPSEDKERSLRIIDQESRRLSFLVESILSFTHAQHGKLAPVSTDIAVEVAEIVSGFEPLAQSQGVRITTQLEQGIVADVDRGALRQVLLNLLDNAVRYGPPRGTVTITTSRAGDMWTLEVADEGPGVPVGERERIFSAYYRMKRDAGGAVGGTGIGLAVVRRLVEEQRGRVHVASANGANGGRASTGARFVVTLPVVAPATPVAS